MTDGQAGRALELAYRYLNRRERTETELRLHLTGKDLAASAVDEAVVELREQGYLDDARYARVFAQDKRALEGWGSERIRRALLQRGVGREHIAAALAEEGASAEAERARELLQHRFPSPPSDPRDRERALGVLLRKGFDSELALEAISSYRREAGEPSSETAARGRG
jgi:regulatory protein